MDIIERKRAEEALRNRQIACEQYACEFGIDRPEDADWKWPF
jgi:xylulose-5-phosphate/fructose-6-phosphate phosphoketolase